VTRKKRRCATVVDLDGLFHYIRTVFPLIEARSQIKAVSDTSRESDFICSNRSRASNISRGKSKGEYNARLVGLPGISLCSNKYKTKNLGVLNTCSSVNRVVLIEARSLIQAGGF